MLAVSCTWIIADSAARRRSNRLGLSFMVTLKNDSCGPLGILRIVRLNRSSFVSPYFCATSSET
jgi:hypothetical protein